MTTLTLMFEDLEGSTAFLAAHGDQAWRAVQQDHDRLVRSQVEPRHATDVVFLGDGYLVAFASPEDALDAAVGIQRAMAARDQDTARSVEAQAPFPLRARIGLHTGHVARDGRGHLVGSAVHAASRMTGKAAGGHIFVSQAVRDGTSDAPSGAGRADLSGRPDSARSFVDRGLFWLKGFPDRWRLHELLWTDGSGGATPTAATRIVGRERELADLRRLREQAESGNGHLALIGGEPGVGKTALAAELMAEAASRGAITLAGHCYQMETPPFTPFVEILEAAAALLPADTLRAVLGDAAAAAEIGRMWPGIHRLLPDLPQPLGLPPEQARRYLLVCLADAFDRLSRTAQLVMLLDDLQWADPSTVLFVQHLTPLLPDMPALVLGTYRDTEVELGMPFADALETLIRRPAVERLSIRRLTGENVRALIAGLADRDPPDRLVDVVFTETEGNALFVEEVFHYLAEEGKLFDERGEWRPDVAFDESEVPQGVRLLLGRRLARLSDSARDVLATAAVAGRGATLRLLQRLTGDGVRPGSEAELLDALDEAERAHLVTFITGTASAAGGAVGGAADTALQFSHELIRQTLLADLPTLRRRRMHARVAEELESLHAGDDDPAAYAADLCYHLLQALPFADPEKVAHHLMVAGDRDIEAAAFEDALRRFEQALALEPTGPRVRADLDFGLGRALRALGRWDEAVERWKRAIDAYVVLGEPEAAGKASRYAAEQLSWTARWDEALVVAGEGLAALGDIANGDRVGLTSNVAVMFSAGTYREAADQMLAEALDMAEALGNPGLAGQVLGLEAVHHYFFGEPHESVATGLRSAELLRAAGDTWNLANALSFVALNAAMTLDFERTNATAAEAIELADRLGHLPAFWLAHRAHWIELQTGELEPFERFCERDLELIRGLPWISGAHMFAGVAHLRRGRWPEAVDAFRDAIDQEVAEAFRPGDVGMLALALAYAGEQVGLPADPRRAPQARDPGLGHHGSHPAAAPRAGARSKAWA